MKQHVNLQVTIYVPKKREDTENRLKHKSNLKKREEEEEEARSELPFS